MPHRSIIAAGAVSHPLGPQLAHDGAHEGVGLLALRFRQMHAVVLEQVIMPRCALVAVRPWTAELFLSRMNLRMPCQMSRGGELLPALLTSVLAPGRPPWRVGLPLDTLQGAVMCSLGMC